MPFVEAKNVTLISLVLGTLVTFGAALFMLRDSPVHALKDARHTMDTVGWAAILPQIIVPASAAGIERSERRDQGAMANGFTIVDRQDHTVASIRIPLLRRRR